MIKQIIRISCLPVQIIFDWIRHKVSERKMMSSILKINRNLNYCASIKE